MDDARFGLLGGALLDGSPLAATWTTRCLPLDAQQRATEADRLRKAAAGVVLDGFKEVNSELARLERDADALEEDLEKSAATMAAIEVRLLPIRPRSRGERRSLRTFPVVTLHPRFPFNV